MKWLVDNALSPTVADDLTAAGHDAVHVRTLDRHQAPDEVIRQAAVDQDRILISADTDFGTMLTLGKVTRPSVVLFRHGAPRRPQEQAALLLANVELKLSPKTSRQVPSLFFIETAFAFVVWLRPANVRDDLRREGRESGPPGVGSIAVLSHHAVPMTHSRTSIAANTRHAPVHIATSRT